MDEASHYSDDDAEVVQKKGNIIKKSLGKLTETGTV